MSIILTVETKRSQKYFGLFLSAAPSPHMWLQIWLILLLHDPPFLSVLLVLSTLPHPSTHDLMPRSLQLFPTPSPHPEHLQFRRSSSPCQVIFNKIQHRSYCSLAPRQLWLSVARRIQYRFSWSCWLLSLWGTYVCTLKKEVVTVTHPLLMSLLELHLHLETVENNSQVCP